MPGGSGQVIINHIDFEDYFKSKAHRMAVTQPLVLTDNLETFDVYVNVRGGGSRGRRVRPGGVLPELWYW